MVSFFHHTISLSVVAAPITSKSPSLSKSATATEAAPLNALSMLRFVHAVPLPFVFSHHETALSVSAEPMTSISPSSSMSPTQTEDAPLTLLSTERFVHALPSPAAFVFSHQAISLPVFAAPSTSKSPSPSISKTKTDAAPPKEASMLTSVQVLPSPAAFVFFHQLISPSVLAAPMKSMSPSPSISAA